MDNWRPLFFIFVFSTHLKVNNCSIKVCRWLDLNHRSLDLNHVSDATHYIFATLNGFQLLKVIAFKSKASLSMGSSMVWTHSMTNLVQEFQLKLRWCVFLILIKTGNGVLIKGQTELVDSDGCEMSLKEDAQIWGESR